MENIKRWYIFLTCAVSLNVVTWAVITLVRRLVAPGISGQAEVFALQLAVILIGLPLYLAHWRWAQRLAAEANAERAATLRSVYLHAVMAGLLIPAIANLYTLVVDGALKGDLTPVLTSLVAMLILTLLYIYHLRVYNADCETLGQPASPLVARLYRLGFSAGGLMITVAGSIGLLRWLFQYLNNESRSWVYGGPGYGPETEAIRLLVGVGLWVIFWRQAQATFASQPEEQTAVTRKVYLYLVIFISLLSCVGDATILFAGLLRRLMSLPPQGSLLDILPGLVVALVTLAYHASVLRRVDGAAPTGDTGGVRRVYLYLVAGVGLAALLIGLAGDLGVLVNGLTANSALGITLKEQFAWFTAAIVAGLPTWLLPWRQAQAEASAESRRSLARRIYLYFFLFVSVMTALGSLIAIVYQLLLLLFGERSGHLLGRDISLAVGYALIAVGTFIYHNRSLRQDDQKAKTDKTARLAALKVLVLDGGDGSLGAALQTALKAEFDGLEPVALGLTPAASDRLTDSRPADENPAELIGKSGLLIGPWSILGGGEGIPAALVSAVSKSAAHKILLPLPGEGLDWAGLESRDQKEWVGLAVRAVKQYLAGEPVAYKPPLGVAAYAWIGIGLLILFGMVMSLIDSLSYRF